MREQRENWATVLHRFADSALLREGLFISRQSRVVAVVVLLSLSTALRFLLVPLPPLKGDMDIMVGWATSIRSTA